MAFKLPSSPVIIAHGTLSMKTLPVVRWGMKGTTGGDHSTIQQAPTSAFTGSETDATPTDRSSASKMDVQFNSTSTYAIFVRSLCSVWGKLVARATSSSSISTNFAPVKYLIL
ncbi:MAG: hypothetical protein IPI00_15510 [Flavobacteriales bacterium]|nr:hypothetical protein [Flavobacteriales bacterium]MBK6945414.1 hypothetical protein [Flavobacteriales bacterium]MBK7241530.1 hypothetical protein [Flavobacteriales bacterium]MBK7298359.1 hypothetical protein [Flavobacteriales bacterium]MBK9535028.1 hypothetical protein [Flavobacteriales bacterium]